MGQSDSGRSRGTGLAGSGVADGVLAVICGIEGEVVGRPGGTSGTGELRRAGDDVVVISRGVLIATCDPLDPTTATLHACMGQGFAYSASVSADEGGVTRIDVAPTG